MKDAVSNNALLPAGFEDLLPPRAETEYRAIAALMAFFAKHGYGRVRPPMAEFEDSLLAPGPGAAMAQDTFRVMDPVSHRMLGLRSDITAQIARIASSRLADLPRPLRLTYANDVIRTRSSQQRTQRQFCQVGCEMIGVDTPEADIEIAVVALSGLASLDVPPVTIDLAVPELLRSLLAEAKIAGLEAEAIKNRLASRDEAVLKNLDPSLQKALGALLQAAGPAESALKTLQGLKFSGAAKILIARLGEVVAGIEKAVDELGLKSVAITIDPLENRGFEYHNGIAFTLFAKGVRGEIGRGGRYDIFCDPQNNPQSAAGFTLYMDTLGQAVKPDDQVQRISVPVTESWASVKKLQAEGWIVVRSMDKNNAVECTHIYKNGKIEEIN